MQNFWVRTKFYYSNQPQLSWKYWTSIFKLNSSLITKILKWHKYLSKITDKICIQKQIKNALTNDIFFYYPFLNTLQYMQSNVLYPKTNVSIVAGVWVCIRQKLSIILENNYSQLSLDYFLLIETPRQLKCGWVKNKETHLWIITEAISQNPENEQYKQKPYKQDIVIPLDPLRAKNGKFLFSLVLV